MINYEQLKKDIINADMINASTAELQEGFMRSGAAVVYGAKAKQDGAKIVRAANSGRGKFDRVKREDDLEKRIELLAEGLEDLSVSIIYIRMMLGNMTGIGVTSALFGDKTFKLITKLLKGLKIK